MDASHGLPVVVNLIKAAYHKCFGKALLTPLSQEESKVFSQEILRNTGLVIGAKSLKNYSKAISNEVYAKFNPTTATLDTLARYVEDAPKTTEADRANTYEYWYIYEKRQRERNNSLKKKERISRKFYPLIFSILMGVLLLILFLYFNPILISSPPPEDFFENFTELHEDSLRQRGWFFKQLDSKYWSMRGQREGCLTLFTLNGGQWISLDEEKPEVVNSLWREIKGNCYEVTVYYRDLVPSQNFQQTGLFLAKDSTHVTDALLTSFNFSGADPRFPRRTPKRVLANVIFREKDTIAPMVIQPERIGQYLVIARGNIPMEDLRNSFRFFAIRIVKRGNTISVYESHGYNETQPFHFVHKFEVDFEINYLELFAHRSFWVLDNPEIMPVHVDKFEVKYCEE